MTKKLLLAAGAIGVLAFAGAASANEISIAKVSGLTVYDSENGTASTPYPVASETISTNATRLTTGVANQNTVSFTLDDGFQAGASYQFTAALSGAALTTALGNSAFSSSNTAANPCLTISKVGTTGNANSASVTFNVVAGTAGVGTCTVAGAAALGDATTVTIDLLQFRATALAPVNVTVTGALSASNTLVGADNRADISQSVPLAALVKGYEARIDAVIGKGAGSNTFLSLTPEPVYSTLGGDGLLGSIGYGPANLTGFAASNAFVGFAATNLPTVDSSVELSISGTDFETLIPAGFTADEDNATIATGTVTGFDDVEVSVASGVEAAIASGNVTVQAKVTPEEANGPAASAITLGEAFSGALEVIELQGTSFLAPWVQSTNPNYNTVIRLSNGGSRPTGSVQLALTSPLRTPTNTTCTVAGVPANGELAINSAQLTSCFGDFGRGDVTVTVLSLGDNLTAKLRIVNPGNVVSEQSLGRTSGVAEIADANQ